jgi:hypothetical protein
VEPADEYLYELADKVSELSEKTEEVWQSDSDALSWHQAWRVQAAPEVAVDVDLVEFDVACQAARPQSVARLMWTPGVPERLRQRLATHPHHEVRGWVAAGTRDRHLHALLSNDPDPRVRAGAVRSRFTTPDRLREFAKDRRAEVRASVAADARAPKDLLMTMTKDRSSTVRWQLAFGPHMYDRAILKVLSSDPDSTTASQARGVLWSLDHPDEYGQGRPL